MARAARSTRTWWRPLAAVTILALGAGCAWVDTWYLSKDELDGRDNGTPGSQLAQDYLVARLEELGIAGAVPGGVGADAYRQPFTTTVLGGATVSGTNLFAVIPGTELPDEYVIVGAHYDHVSSCGAGTPVDDTTCNGATDNATGVAAVLDIATHLRDHPARRSVLIALWDAEEDGLAGSVHYTQDPVVPLADTVAYVNYDIAGANLRPSLRDTSFAIGAETGGTVLAGIVEAATAAGPADTVVLSAVFGQYRSDYASFIQAGVPTVFFSDSTGPCYHTEDDELAVVDFEKLGLEIAMGREVTVALADGPVRPTFAAGAPLVTFDDVVALEATVARSLADLHLLTPSQQDELVAAHELLEGVVAAGPGEFTDVDWGPVFNAVLTLVDLLTSGPCESFITP